MIRFNLSQNHGCFVSRTNAHNQQTGVSLVEKAHDIHRLLTTEGLPESQLKKVRKVLSDQEIVARMLHLANDCTYEEKEQAMWAMDISHSMPTTVLEKLASLHGKKFLREFWDSILDERYAFRDRVMLVYENPKAARRLLREFVVAGIDSVVPITTLSLTKQWDVHRDTRYYARDTQAMFAVTLALLLDESKGLGAALKVCKLGPCENFFLSLPSPTGGRPPLYCNRDHQTEYAAQGGRERTKRWRRKKSKPARKSKRGTKQ